MRTATFVKSALSALLAGAALSACQGGGPGVVVTVSPAEIALLPGSEQTFTAFVSGSANTEVAWAATAGVVDGAGATINFHAPAEPGSYELTATSVADPTRHATAKVTVVGPGDRLWTRLFLEDPVVLAGPLAVDGADNILMVGYGSELAEREGERGTDVLVRKYSPAAELIWERRFGSLGDLEDVGLDDLPSSIAADAAGRIVVGGSTTGPLAGPNQGKTDAFVRLFAATGETLWTRQFGTSEEDYIAGVAMGDEGRVIVVGTTEGTLQGPVTGYRNAFVRMYDLNGDIVWTNQFGGESSHSATAVVVDPAGNIIVTGYAYPGAANQEVFMRAYSAAGALLLSTTFGTAEDDSGDAIAVDAVGNVFVAGSTEGALGADNAGEEDVFLRKYDPMGNVLWTRQFGSGSDDRVVGVATDAAGNALVGGYSLGALAGDSGAWLEGFVRKYSAAGSVIWTRSITVGTISVAAGIAADSTGSVLVSGSAYVQDDYDPDASTLQSYLVKLAP